MTRAASTPAQRLLRRHLIVSTALVSAICAGGAASSQVLSGIANVVSQSHSGEIGAAGAHVSNSNSTTLNVDLKANATIITWNGFNVPSQNTAVFADTRAPGATGAITVLNRDIATAGSPAVPVQSVINGTINSDPNVSVFIINKAGVLFGSTAVVNVGGLVASAVDITDGSFLSPVTGYAFAGSTGSKVTVSPGANLNATSAVAPGSILLVGEDINSGGALAASGDVGIVLAAAATIAVAPGSPLSITLGSGTSVAGAKLVATGSMAGRNVVFAAASQTGITNVLLDVEAVVTATTAVATDRGIVLVAGPNSEANPLVTVAATETGAVTTLLGSALTVTGTQGAISLLTATGIAAPTLIGALPATLTASAGVRVHAATGDIVLGGVDAGAGTASILADGGGITLVSLAGVAGSSASGKTLALGNVGSSGGAVTLTATTGALTAAAVSANSTVEITAAAGLQLDSATGNGITIGATSLGAAATGRTALTSTGDIGLTLSGNALLGAVSAAGTATVQAASVDATSLTGGTALSATGGALTIGSAGSANGSVQLVATSGTLAVDSAAAKTTVAIKSSGSAQVGSARGSDITLTATSLAGTAGGRANFAATAGLDLTITNAASLGTITAVDHATITAGSADASSLVVSGGLLTATATAGDLVLGTGTGMTGATLRALTGALTATQLGGGTGTIDAKAQSLDIGSIVNGGLTLTSTLTTLKLGGGSAGPATLTAATDMIVTGTLAVTGSATLTAPGSFTGGTVTATGALTLDTPGAVTATKLAGDAGLTVKGSSVYIGSIGSVSGLADVSTTAGLLTIGGGFVQTANLVSTGDLAITGTLSGTGAMALNAQGKLTGGTVSSTGSTLQASATGALSADSLFGATGLTVKGSTVTLRSVGTTSGNALLTATSGAAIVTGGVTVGGDYRISATDVTLGDGTPVLQTASGVIDIVASTGAITGLGQLTLRSDSGGAGGHLLALDAAGGISFAASSLLQGGPAQQSGVGVRLGAGLPLVLGGVDALRLGIIDATHTTIGALNNVGPITLGGPVMVTQSLAIGSTTGLITTAAISVTGTGQTLSIMSGIGTDIVSTGPLSATAAVTLNGDRDVTVADVTSSGANVTAIALGTVTAGTITAASAVAVIAGSATIAGLVSGTDGAAADRSASVTAANASVSTFNIGTDLLLKATAGPLTLGSGSAGNSVTLTTLGAGGTLMLTGNLDVGTAAGSSGAAMLNSSADARLFSLHSLTGNVTVTAAGAVTGLANGGGFDGAVLSAPATGHDVSVNAGGLVKLAALTAGRDVIVTTSGVGPNGSAVASGAVAAGRNYTVTGSVVTLGSGAAITQQAGGTVTIVSTAGEIVGRSQLTLASDSGGLGGRDLILRSTGAILFSGTALSGGPVRTSSVRLAAAPGATIALGTVDALQLVSYDPALTATALDSSGAVSADRITVLDDLIIGSTVAGQPASVTLNAATSLTGAIRLASTGAIAGPLVGEQQFASAANLTAAISITTRSSSAELGLVTAGGFVDVQTSGNLDLETSSAGTTTGLAAGGDIRLGGASGIGDITVLTGGDLTGFANGPATFGRAQLTSTAGGVAVSANGVPATTGLILLGAVQAATGTAITGRQLDVTSSSSGGTTTMQARELSPANLVSLTLGTATAGGDITLASAAGTGSAPAVANGSVVVDSATSSGGNVTLVAATSLTASAAAGTSLTAAKTIAVTAGQLVQIATATAGNAIGISAGDSVTAGHDGRIELGSATATGGSLTLAAYNVGVTGLAGIAVGSATSGTDATLTTTGTRGDIGAGSLTAGTQTGAPAAMTISAVGNARLGSLTNLNGNVLINAVDVTGTAVAVPLAGAPDPGFGRTSVSATTGLHITASGLVQLGTASAGSDLTATAALLDVDQATATTGALALTATGTSLRLGIGSAGGAATLSAGGLLTATRISAGTDLQLHGATVQVDRADAATITSVSTAATRLTTANATGAITATAGSDFDFTGGAGTGIASTGGNVVINAAGAVTGTTLSAGQAITVKSQSLNIGSATAGTTLTTTTTGYSQFGSASAGGAVLVTADSLDFGSIASTAGDTTLTVAGGITGTTLLAAKRLSVTAASLNLDTATAGATLTSATTAATSVNTVLAGGDIALTAGTTLGFGTVTSTGGSATLTVGSTLTGTTVSAAQAIGINAGSVQLGKAIAGTALGIQTNADLVLTSASAGGTVALNAGGNLRLGSVTGGGTVALLSGGDITGLAGDAGFGRAVLTSTAGSVSAGATGLVMLGAVQAATGVTLTGRQLDVTSAAVSAGGITMHALELSPATLVALTLGTASASGDIVLAAAAGSAAAPLAGNGTIGLGSATSSGGRIDVSAPGAVIAGALSAETSIRGSGGSLALASLNAGTTIDLTSSTGGITLTSATASNDITLTSAGATQLTAATSSAGGFGATAAGNFSAGTLSAAKTVSVNAAALGVDAATAGGALSLTATSGNARLGTATAGGSMIVTASGNTALIGAVTDGGDLTVAGASVDLAATATVVQASAGAVTVTAATGTITGGAGLTLISGSGGSGKMLSLKALGTSGAVTFAPTSAIAGGTAAAGADVGIAATGLVQLGRVDAAGHAITIAGSDAALAAGITAAQITLANSGSGPLRLGDTPAANAGEFAAVTNARFDLSSAEVARLSAPVLIVDARAQNVVVGDLPIGAATGASSFALRTLGRLDMLGRVAAAGSAAGRTLSFGGDGSATGMASVIRIATTPAAGGRLIAAGAKIVLNGDRIGAGYDANLLVPLTIAPGSATALSTSEVASRYVSQPNSALYVASAAGQPVYSDPLIIGATTLVVNYGRYALFQNTGQPGFPAGITVGAPGGSGIAALQINARDVAVANAFAVFATVNGIGGTATALLGNNSIAVGGGVSRADARANGCVIGATSGGCLSSSLAQPGLQLFTSRSEILRSSDNLALPFDPLVGTSNEALFSDVVGSDPGADVVGGAVGTATPVVCVPGQRPCKDPHTVSGAPK